MSTSDVSGADESVEAAIVRWAQSALQRAGKWLRAEGLPTISDRQYAFTGASSFTRPLVTRVNYELFVQRHEKEISQLPETHDCIRRLWDDGTMRLLLPSSDRTSTFDALTDQRFHQLAWRLYYVLADVLQRWNTFQPTSDQILESYAIFRDGWTATHVRHVANIPLLNFTAQLTVPVPVSPHFSIAPFSDEEKGRVWNVMSGFHGPELIPFHTFMQTGFQLVTEWTLPHFSRVEDQAQAGQEFAQSDLSMLTELRNILTAFRLTIRGDIAVTSYVERTNEVPPDGYPSMRHLGVAMSDFQIRRYGSTYAFEDVDLAGIRSLIEDLGRLDGRKDSAGLDDSLRRFNQSYSREYYEDRLIDLTIALETALLSEPGIRFQLKQRFASHGAALLAYERDPEQTRTFLAKMYKVRSAVVHSNKRLGVLSPAELLGLEWRDFVQSCEDTTRMILAAYIRELTKDPKSTVSSITIALDRSSVPGPGS